jgi:glycosyltransferase involved in cell wall biosynthesis
VRELPGTEAIIYGNGPDRERVRRCLEEEKVGERVRLGGHIDNPEIQRVMLDASIIVLLSDYEGLPIALLEGMACGLIPVCLRIRSGVGQLIEPGRTGLLVDDRGDAFVATIRAIASTTALRTRVSSAARERIAAEYSNEANAERWTALLTDRSRQSPRPEASIRSLLHGIRSLEFLDRTVSRANAKPAGFSDPAR